ACTQALTSVPPIFAPVVAEPSGFHQQSTAESPRGERCGTGERRGRPRAQAYRPSTLPVDRPLRLSALSNTNGVLGERTRGCALQGMQRNLPQWQRRCTLVPTPRLARRLPTKVPVFRWSACCPRSPLFHAAPACRAAISSSESLKGVPLGQQRRRSSKPPLEG